MGKILNSYFGYTAANIISRATAGVATLTTSGANVDASNILLTGAKAAIAESVNGLGALCVSNKVNKFSNFGPIERYIGGTLNIQFRAKTPYSLGNFAGYNHSAQAPINNGFTHYYNSGVSNYIFALINISEVNWGELGAVKLIGYAYINDNLVGTGIVDLSTYSGGNIDLTVPITDPLLVSNTTITFKVYAANSSNTPIFRIPNITDMLVNYIAQTISFTWLSTQYGTRYIQQVAINTEGNTWTVSSTPTWISYSVTHPTSGAVRSPPYQSGYILNLYPNAENFGAQRVGNVLISTGATFSTTQQGNTAASVVLGSGYFSQNISNFSGSYGSSVISYSFTYSGTTYNSYYVTLFVDGVLIDSFAKGRIQSGSESGTISATLQGGSVGVLYFSETPLID